MDNVTMGKSPESVTPGNEKPAKPTCQWCGFERTGANVINAAPELLAALKEFTGVWDRGEKFSEIDADEITAMRRRAAAAIAKAEGRS